MRGLESSRTTVRSIAKDFKAFISGMTHVRPVLPAIEREDRALAQDLKSDALRASPTSLEEARRLMERFVKYYNGVRLHSAIGYCAAVDDRGRAPCANATLPRH